MDGSFWDLDVSTPMTADGLARPAPGDPIPLGVSRGTRLSRAKQIHFMQRFMTAPFVPSYAASSHGFVLHRVLTIPFSQNWYFLTHSHSHSHSLNCLLKFMSFTDFLRCGGFRKWRRFGSLLGQFNFQKMVSSVKESGETPNSASTWLKTIGKHLRDKSLYVLGFSSELLLTPDDTMLLSFDSYTFGDNKPSRKKAILHHKVTTPMLFCSKNCILCLVLFYYQITILALPCILTTSKLTWMTLIREPKFYSEKSCFHLGFAVSQSQLNSGGSFTWTFCGQVW